MAEVTNELIYEILKQIQERLGNVQMDVSELKAEVQAIRINGVAVQQDLSNIYGILGRHDQRLDRIERRLELRTEPAL